MRGKPDLKRTLAGTIALLVLTLALLGAMASAAEITYPKPCKRSLQMFPMRFAILGDRTGGHVPGVFGAIVEEIERLQPDFVVSVGDLIEGYTEDEKKLEEEWQEFKKLLEPLSMPVHLVPGNHDITFDGMVDQYKKHIGEPDYSFDFRGVHFVMLDTGRWEAPDELQDDQIEWLKKDLAENKEAFYTIVIFHKPYWIQTVARGKPDKLHDIFVANGVDAVFTGHYHMYFSGEYDGIKYTSVGSSGGGTEEDATGLMYHYMWATFNGEELSLALIKKDAVLAWDNMTANDFIFIGELQSKTVTIPKVAVRDDLKVSKTKVTLKINNICDVAPIEDVLKWEVPEGWVVKPEGVQVKVAPGTSADATFTVRCKGPLYPVPSFTLKCPYREGRGPAKVERELGVFRTAAARKAEAPPAIDGKLTENLWVRPSTRFFKPEYAKEEAEPVAFYFAYDRDNLYLAARCTESKMDELKAKLTDRDAMIFGEDCVGYFIQAVDEGPVYQVYFTPLGTVFDQKIVFDDKGAYEADRSWDGEYDVKTVRGSDYWSIEVRLPLGQLGAEGIAGKTFALNFRRKQPRLKTTADWQIPISYDPETFGVLELE